MHYVNVTLRMREALRVEKCSKKALFRSQTKKKDDLVRLRLFRQLKTRTDGRGTTRTARSRG